MTIILIIIIMIGPLNAHSLAKKTYWIQFRTAITVIAVCFASQIVLTTNKAKKVKMHKHLCQETVC